VEGTPEGLAFLAALEIASHTIIGDRRRGHGDCAPMVRWLDYDPIAAAVLIFGLAAVVLLALSI
jgi:hypothetical protein